MAGKSLSRVIFFLLFPDYCIFSYTPFDFRFVATIMHPAFNSSGASRHIQVGEDPATGHQTTLYSINVSRYLDIPPTKGEAIHGQSTAQVCSPRFLFSTHRAGLLEVLLNIFLGQYYFHRPLHEILSVFFRHSLVLDGLEEPGFTARPSRHGNKELSWQNYNQVPPVMAFRLRRLVMD